MNRLAKTSLLFFAALLLPASGCGAWKHRDDITTIQRYENALRASSNPADKAILQEIENGPADLAREKAAAAASGIATTDTSAPPPADENAAPLYLRWQALQRQKKLTFPLYAEPLSYEHTYTHEQIAQVWQLLRSNRALTGLLNQATSQPRFYVKTDSHDAVKSFQVYAPMREAARELCSEAYLLASQKRYSDALAVQIRGLKIARQLTTQPNLMNYLVEEAVFDVSIVGCRSICVMAGPNAALDHQVRQAVLDHTPTLSLKRTMIGELPNELSALDALRTASPDNLGLSLGFSNPLPANVSFDYNSLDEKVYSPAEKLFLNHMIDAAEARIIARVLALAPKADEPLPLMREQADFAGGMVPQNESGELKYADYYPRLANIFLSIFGSLADHEGYTQAYKQVTLATAALLSAKAQTGRFPDALPGSFPDPYTGRPLGYRREGVNGFVVYSVGETGKYDGGKPMRSEVFLRYPPAAPTPVPESLLR